MRDERLKSKRGQRGWQLEERLLEPWPLFGVEMT